MNNQILLEQLLSFWPQVNLIEWVQELDNYTKICIINFKGTKTLLLLDELVYTSDNFGTVYLVGRMEQLRRLIFYYNCSAGILITPNKDLPSEVYKKALSKQINLIDLDDLSKIFQKLNCPYLLNFLTIQVNVDLINN